LTKPSVGGRITHAHVVGIQFDAVPSMIMSQ